MNTIKYLALFFLTLGIGWAAGTYGVQAIQGIFASQQVEKGDYASYGVTAQTPIKLYTTQWCPFCKKATQYLSQRSIEFINVDIEQDPEALKEFEALGGEVLPIILVSDGLIRGFNEAALEAQLKSNNLL
ncbi:glutaredoxin family protein [Pseudoalteromonas luteoviolacea]|uniref:glutaredoxin family protein n=1 Tax=Pseudoalteromonas luteoviolacea TaxID=43657 RepID=UPI00068DAE45|nr:glutaredoxin family protein [Pseudoalteromonas luteoviolacea]